MRMLGCFGGCGSGKTERLRRLIAAEQRAAIARGRGAWVHLVLDLNDEFPGDAARGTPRLRCTIVQSVAQARAAMERGDTYVIVRPGIDPDAADAGADVQALADELAAEAIRRRGVILVLPEAHLACPEGKPLAGRLKTIVHRWRHPRVVCGLWVDTQHFRDLNKEVEDALQLFYFHGTGSVRDLRRIRGVAGEHGPELVAVVREAGRLVQQKQPGWHVVVPSMRTGPPYQLRR